MDQVQREWPSDNIS